MRVITTKAELVGWLFEVLRRAEPQRTVDASFLIAIGALCQGLSSGARVQTSDCWSQAVLTARPGQPVLCGLKLIKLARSLAEEGVLDCTRIWSASRLVRRMVAALDSHGLRVQEGRGLAPSYVKSSPLFAAERGVKVRVRLGRRWRSGWVFHPPLDFAKVRRAELEEALRVGRSELMHLRQTLEAAEGRRADLQVELERATAALLCEQQRVRQLENNLLNAQVTIQQQQMQLTNATMGDGNPIYRRVGLHERCPDFVLKAAKKAYAFELHPDRRPDNEKRKAEERLKEVNAVFDDIYSMRAMR